MRKTNRQGQSGGGATETEQWQVDGDLCVGSERAWEGCKGSCHQLARCCGASGDREGTILINGGAMMTWLWGTGDVQRRSACRSSAAKTGYRRLGFGEEMMGVGG